MIAAMKELVDYFDRGYVINLRERTDRRRGAVKEFRKIGIEVPSSKIEFYTAIRPTEPAQFPTAGARGSFTSHRDILDLAQRDRLRNVLVFEDDIRFLDFNTDQTTAITNRLRQIDWDIVYFGYL